MARKRPLPSDDLPPSSSDDKCSTSSEDEESEESEAKSDSDDEEAESDSNDEDNKEEQKTPTQPKSSPRSPPPPPQRKSQGGSSSTKSESRHYTVMPMEKIVTRSAKKRTPEPSSSTKRKVEVEDSKEGKKDVARNGSLQKSGESKKLASQRIWADNDEIVLLQGMIDFREKKGMDPSVNTRASHRYVKKLLGQDFTDSQLVNKVRVLKKKHNTNEGKGKDGENRAFSKPHERKLFKFSKNIGGANKNSDAGASGEQMSMLKADITAKKSKTTATSKVVPAPELKLERSPDRPKENGERIPAEHIDTMSMLSYDKMLQISGIDLDEDFFKKGWEMVDVLKKEELKQRWRNLQLTEMLVVAERATLIRDQTNLVLEAVVSRIGAAGSFL